MNSSALWDCLNYDFPSVAQPAVSVYYLMLWLQKNTILGRPAEETYVHVSLLLVVTTLAVSSLYFGFSRQRFFFHFVMQHTVCVFNVKQLNYKVVLQWRPVVARLSEERFFVSLLSHCFTYTVISINIFSYECRICRQGTTIFVVQVVLTNPISLL